MTIEGLASLIVAVVSAVVALLAYHLVDDLHTTLAEKELTPGEHLVDMGYNLQTVRAAQQIEAFWERYATRASVEGTISQAVIALNMRRSRYRGLTKPICNMSLQL